MRLILTRHPAQSGALGQQLAQFLDVWHMPLTTQILGPYQPQMTTAMTRLAAGEFRWLMLTSGSTVRAMQASGFRGELGAAKVAVVGPGTAEALQQLTGITTDWMPASQYSAAGILAEWSSSAESPILLPQSAQASPLLVEGLRARGWAVEQVTAYETVSISDPRAQNALLGAPETGDTLRPEQLEAPDVVLITASSAARELLAQRHTLPEGVRLLAIGDPTAATMKQLGRAADAVLPQPSASAVLAALELGP